MPQPKEYPGERVKFVQITCTARSNLFGLDAHGRVWRYVPFKPPDGKSDKPRFAFWTKLTDFGRDGKKDAQIREQNDGGEHNS